MFQFSTEIDLGSCILKLPITFGTDPGFLGFSSFYFPSITWPYVLIVSVVLLSISDPMREKNIN